MSLLFRKQKFIVSLAGLFVIFMIFKSCIIQTNRNESHKIIGVKLYKHNGSFKTLFDRYSELGINTIFSSEELAHNTDFRTEVRAHKLRYFIIIPIFYDPEALNAHPDLYAIKDDGNRAIKDWVHFICPSRKNFRNKKITYITDLVKKYNPDGISLDFIRYFSFWEKIYPNANPVDFSNTCYDSSCLVSFQHEMNIKIPAYLQSTSAVADWINTMHKSEWTTWKCNQITSFIANTRNRLKQVKSDIKINVHIVPWREQDYNGSIKSIIGQDIAEISKYVDFLSPMTYSHMLKRDPHWIHSIVADFHSKASCSILPSIQVNKAYLSDSISASEFDHTLLNALQLPSAGVIFWSWDHLVNDEAKQGIIMKQCNGIDVRRTVE